MSKCPKCGTEAQDEAWPTGVCPACLLKLGLSGAISTSSLPDNEPEPAPQAKRAQRQPAKWPWFRIATAFIALGALIAWAALRVQPPAPAPVRFTIPLPNASEAGDFAVSPDGRALAFTATDDSGETMLWFRPFDLLTPRLLRETQGAAMPFWSPDSRQIGFFAGGKLKEIGIDGSLPHTLAEAPGGRGGTWSADSGILFAEVNVGLFRVPAAGGIPQRAIATDAQAVRTRVSWPQFLPDGHSFLFYAEGPDPSKAGIYVGDLASSETRRLVEQSGPGIFAEGRLLFSRGGVLMAQPLDLRRMELAGEPNRIGFAETVSGNARRSPGFSAGNGVLAYRAGGGETSRLVWMDRLGSVLGEVGEPDDENDFALSPDGTSVAFVRRAGDNRGGDLWLLDLRRSVTSRLTFDGLGAHSPVWSPDGKHISFYTFNEREMAIRQLSIKGSGQIDLLLSKTPELATLGGWSPDGKVLLFTSMDHRERQAVWMLPNSDPKPIPVVQGEFNYGQPALSPDGRWMAYVSDESGRDEVYIRAFPSSEVKLQVSAEGGSHPAWQKDGREIFFASPGRLLMAVPVSQRERIELGSPTKLFRLPGNGKYQTTSDGRFLVARPVADEVESPIHVVMNWANEK